MEKTSSRSSFSICLHRYICVSVCVYLYKHAHRVNTSRTAGSMALQRHLSLYIHSCFQLLLLPTLSNIPRRQREGGVGSYERGTAWVRASCLVCMYICEQLILYVHRRRKVLESDGSFLDIEVQVSLSRISSREKKAQK